MKRLLENWRKLLEGEVIQGPWKKKKPAEAANEVESYMQKQMMDAGYGTDTDWSMEQLNAFWEINELLNDIFISGDEEE